ncbi:MAG: hypothetical protein PWR03_1351 [Tenuifilum sp.]|jgi:O-antigen/teichoic acid export membrane protein|uniref:lipopolysaccharide biosynthesis protein n=1 Tax=Tenuifilum sp. TaxID=2760880 RepID=UPI0024ABBEA2|nr:oligosaccharide flippase family protein [Tenuifilum sp.]MDI3527168.1 hypothetical protein [Tenuifilum sp.]
MISKSFIKSSFIYTIVGALPLASSILLLPFYGNQSLLSTSDYGMLAIYLTIAELGRVLFTFATDNFIGLNYIHYSNSEKQKETFIGTSALFMLLYGVILLLVLSSLGQSIFDLAYPGKNINFFPYGFASLLTGMLNGNFKAYTTLQIYREKPLPYFWANITQVSIIITISIVGLYLKPLSLDAPIYARLTASIVSFIWAFSFFISRGKLTIDFNILKRLFSYAAPLYVYYLLYWVINNIDRYLILGLISKESVAIFDFAVKVTMALELFQSGLAGAISPKVFKLWKSNNDNPWGTIEINKYYHVYALINIAIIPLYYFILPIAIPLVVNNTALYSSFCFLPILFATRATRIWYYYLSSPIFYFQKTKIMPIVFATVAVFQVGLTYMLIKLMGINGALWANFATRLFQATLIYLYVRTFYKLNINTKKMFLFPGINILCLILLFILDLNVFLNVAILATITSISSYLTYHKELDISSIKRMVFNKD